MIGALPDGTWCRRRIAHLAAFGSAGPSGALVTPQTPFRVGSVSKSFTALAALQLMERGALDLDARVQSDRPWFHVGGSGDDARITVRHLLSHTSGISTRSGRRILSSEPLTRAVSDLADVELAAAPGERFEYSNANYPVLGAIIEALTATALADTIERVASSNRSGCGMHTPATVLPPLITWRWAIATFSAGPCLKNRDRARSPHCARQVLATAGSGRGSVAPASRDQHRSQGQLPIELAA